MKNLPSGLPEDEALAINVGPDQVVSALLRRPPDARACYVLAHGAGAGMRHAFLEATATGLAERGIATLRFQFPYMERGSRRPDHPELAHTTIRAAVEVARCRTNLPLVAGGKSFGGRMTSQAHALSPLPGVRGLAFLGFPLHPAGRPACDRGAHLFDIHIPMLFLQGTRDDLASLDQLLPLCVALGDRAQLVLLHSADHSFRVPARWKKGRGGQSGTAAFSRELDQRADCLRWPRWARDRLTPRLRVGMPTFSQGREDYGSGGGTRVTDPAGVRTDQVVRTASAGA